MVNVCATRDVFNGVFGRTILMVSADATKVEALGFLSQFHGELFCGIDAVVCVVLRHSDANGLCLPLKRELGTNGFSGGKTDLMMNGDEGPGGITEDSATMVHEAILSMSTSREVFAFNTRDIFVRKDVLTRKELVPLESALFDLGMDDVGNRFTLHTPNNTPNFPSRP